MNGWVCCGIGYVINTVLWAAVAGSLLLLPARSRVTETTQQQFPHIVSSDGQVSEHNYFNEVFCLQGATNM